MILTRFMWAFEGDFGDLSCLRGFEIVFSNLFGGRMVAANLPLRVLCVLFRLVR